MQPENESIMTKIRIAKIRESKTMFPLHLTPHQKNVMMLAFNKSETLLATCSANKQLKIFNCITFQMINQYQFDVAIKFLSFSATDKIVASSIFSDFFVIDPYLIQSE